MSSIPILVICYNNHRFVRNTIEQFQRINVEYYRNITVIDNHSTDPATISFLKELVSTHPEVRVHWYPTNPGPWVDQRTHTDIYNSLPDKFVLTDPDLAFHPDLPSNFLDVLSDISDRYQCERIGFALSLDDLSDMFQEPYPNNKTIYECENHFWRNGFTDPATNVLMYNARIDTTFHLMNKRFLGKIHYRVAGNYTARHLPWYKKNPIMNTYESYLTFKNQTHISSTAYHVNNYIHKEFMVISTHGEEFLIHNRQKPLGIWQDKSFWARIEPSLQAMDKHLTRSNIYIELGGWVGPTCIYGARKAKHTYVVEPNQAWLPALRENCENNCYDVTIVPTEISTQPTPSKILQIILEHYQLDPATIGLVHIRTGYGLSAQPTEAQEIYHTYRVPVLLNDVLVGVTP